MHTSRFGLAKEHFLEACELPADKRAAFLDAVCDGDAPLRADVETLLAAHQDADADRGPTLISVETPAPQLQGLDEERQGQRIGPYVILELIGHGGFGSVYVAQQEIPVRRRVALKIVKAGMDTRQVIARFEAERQALALMDHPNIAQVFDGGSTAAGRPYFVMELVRGLPITDYCKQNDLSPQLRLNLMVQVCRAVQHAHQKGIIHRDLKPSNILISVHDDKPVVKVIDFGIAKAMYGPLTDRTVYTQLRQVVGTPAYMSPEQAGLSDLDIDTRTDVYSLGVILYELLTQSLPVDSAAANADAIPEPPSARISRVRARPGAARPGQDPRQLARLFRGELDWVVMKCLERQRARRYDAVSDLAADIERFLTHQPVLARPPSPMYIASKWLRRHRTLTAVAAAVLLTATAGLTASIIGFVKADRQRAIAIENADKQTALRAYMEDILFSLDPERARGNRQITVVEMLDSAAAKLDAGSLASRPGVEAAMRLAVGRTYRLLGKLPEAEKHLKLALAASDRGVPDVDRAEILRSLAIVYHDTSRYSEALPMSEEVLQLAIQTPGSDVGGAQNDVASLLADMTAEHHVRADQLFRDAIAWRTAHRGANHTETASVMNNYATFLYQVGRVAEATEQFQKSLAIHRAQPDAKSPTLVYALANVGYLLMEQERMEEARAHFEEALELCTTVLGPTTPLTSTILGNLAFTYQSKGELAKAIPLLERGVELRRASSNTPTEGLSDSLQNLTVTCNRAGDFVKALPVATECLNIRRGLYTSPNSRLCDALSNLGTTLMGLKRPAEAEPLFRESLTMRKAVMKPDDPKLQETLDRALSRLNESLTAQGKPVE